jgi:hypothetical protein
MENQGMSVTCVNCIKSGSDIVTLSVCHIPLGYDTDTSHRIRHRPDAKGYDTNAGIPTGTRARSTRSSDVRRGIGRQGHGVTMRRNVHTMAEGCTEAAEGMQRPLCFSRADGSFQRTVLSEGLRALPFSAQD